VFVLLFGLWLPGAADHFEIAWSKDRKQMRFAFKILDIKKQDQRMASILFVVGVGLVNIIAWVWEKA
jgi:hypothetical protein